MNYHISGIYCAKQLNRYDLFLTEPQQRRWIMYTMPRYEVRYNENEEWEEISELEFMDRLYKLYHRVTPAIKEILEGKELRTLNAAYRLKWQFGNSRMTRVDQNHLSPVHR
jgi:hypothetical protein